VTDDGVDQSSLEVRVLAATGVLGSGFLEDSFERALALAPHVIGADAGSTDPGPAYLGTGQAAFPRAAVKRDLRLMVKGARRQGIPLILGSAGTAGGDPHVDWLEAILCEIAAEERLTFKLAVTRAEQRRETVERLFNAGRVLPLENAPALDADVIARSRRIVGLMGAEPFIEALAAGANVVLAGRSTDTAIFAALPLARGIPAAIAWHAAKVLECGAAATERRTTPDCLMAWLRRDHFTVEPPNPAMRCTPQSIAAHAFYENADPFRLVEPSGVLDLEAATYAPEGSRAVRVSGSRFHPAERYTVKLEGVELAGHMAVLIGSVRDPFIIRQIDDWLGRLQHRVAERMASIYGECRARFRLDIRVYGKNGTMGPLEPQKEIRSHELAIVFEATAETQDLANAVAGVIRHQALHLPIPEWDGMITAMAFPYGFLERGPVYRFTLNHVAVPDDPFELFPVAYREIHGDAVRTLSS
jgi:hypothetical protein